MDRSAINRNGVDDGGLPLPLERQDKDRGGGPERIAS